MNERFSGEEEMLADACQPLFFPSGKAKTDVRFIRRQANDVQDRADWCCH